MAELSFPLENTDYGAQEAQLWFSSRTSGVYAGDELPVSAASGMNVVVGKGRAWMAYAEFAGIVYANLSVLTLTVPTADAYYDRVDRVVIHYDRTANTVGAKVISGKAATAAQPPSLTRNDSAYEISVAQIRVKKGTTSITASDISDERLDASVCGLMSDGVTGFDTSVIQAQWEGKLKELQELLASVPNGTAPNAAMLGGKTPEKYMNPKNLAHNSDFTQFVAQAGVGGKHGKQSYAGDRWALLSGSVTGVANENGNGYRNITLNGTIRQQIENAPDVGSAFIGMISGTASITYSNGAITITSAGGVIDHVALYSGAWTEEADHVRITYADTLAECNRFYWRTSGYMTMYGYSTSATNAVLFVSLPVQMRITPTLMLSNATITIRENDGGTHPNASITGSASILNNQLRLTVGNSSLGLKGQNTVTGTVSATNGVFEAIADLEDAG